MNSRGKWITIALATFTIGLFAALLVKRNPARLQEDDIKRLNITLTPYPDTSLFYYGVHKGFFREAGLDLSVKDLTWNEQIEFTAGGGTHIAMATLDELVAKSRNLNAVSKRVVYFLPGWLFEGTIFVCRSDIQSFSELRQKYDEAEAKKAFIRQIKGKAIAVPEGGLYDQAIRRFITSAKEIPDEYTFINTQLETGINGLNDKNVAIAAAGAFERPEALRRGYKVALSPAELDVIVITGFICDGRLYEQSPELLQRFAKAWYRTVSEALAHQDESYTIVKSQLSKSGAKEISLTDYKAALANDRIPTTSAEAKRMFLQSNSPMYWKKAWDAAVKTLKETGKADQVPTSTKDFVAERVLQSD